MTSFVTGFDFIGPSRDTFYMGHELLTVKQMYRADTECGVPGSELMEAAGAAVALVVRQRFGRRPVAVLCGPGNNGGDGFVVARLLENAGWPVKVSLLGGVDDLKGDAAWAASTWPGPVSPLSLESLSGCELVVDALFGAGLSRPLEGVVAEVVEAIDTPCVSIDVPSGVDGDTGQVLGTSPQADVSVTFFRRKPGHLLLPGRFRCGEVVVADIGIPDAALDAIAPQTFANGPDLWRLPTPSLEGHKYNRGHAVVVGGAQMTGAARLAAMGARRMGTGLLTLAVPKEATALYGDAPGHLIWPLEDFSVLMDDPRRNAFLIGPGNGVGAQTVQRVLAVLATGRATVLDADALTSFEGREGELFDAIDGPCVLTPHHGEFAKLFGLEGNRLTQARQAAKQSGAVVVLKGGDTVVAAPDGRAVINDNAPAYLATAGSGDVLAGMVVGLMAQGMEAFDAACAAVWCHGAAGQIVGPGLIAEDLAPALLSVLQRADIY